MDEQTTSIVLCVDDDEPTLELLARYLQSQGVTVIKAISGSEALAILTELGIGIRLIFLDLAMPGLSGYETSTAIRHNLSLTNIPIVAVTARCGPEVEAAVSAAGINRLIQKPFAPRVLVEALVAYGIVEEKVK